MTSVTLHCGDCLDVMRGMPSNSVHSIVTDPPYGLSDGPTKYLGDGGRGGFMGKHWDHGVPGVAFWQEALRVAKPGAMLLAFGGDRTHHRLMVAIEDAGWEIRTCLYWLTGQGFPKSLDIAKQIDKMSPRMGMFDAFAAHFAEQRKASGLSQKSIAAHFPSKTGGMTGCVWNWENGANVPTLEQWRILQPLLNLSNEWLPLIERVEAERAVVGTKRSGIADGPFDSVAEARKHIDITAPATDAARQWAGWGTSLKPAAEIIVMARKPLSEPTVAQNVLVHGVGGLNIDACRIPTGAREQWDVEESRCNTSAKPVESKTKLTTQATREFFATSSVAPTMSEKENQHPDDTSKMDTGCCAGLCREEQATDLIDDSNLNTSKSGKMPTGQSQMAMKSTISMATRETTESKTLNLSHDANTSESTLNKAISTEATKPDDELARLENASMQKSGRWPSNLLLDDEAARLLDEMSGERGGHSAPHNEMRARPFHAGGWQKSGEVFHNDSGGASRFFLRVAHDEDDVPLRFLYCGKASKRDRDEGLEGMPEKPAGALKSGDGGWRNEEARGRQPRHDVQHTARNHHPTVKPTALCRWLVRLVTPPNGTVLDPFMGSGSTGKAAKLEGFHFIGIEIDAEYLAIAEKRIAAAQPDVKAQLPLLELAGAEEVL